MRLLLARIRHIMKIKDILDQKKFSLSCEVFPPKRDGNLENLYTTIKELGEVKPDFISVTYGAGRKYEREDHRNLFPGQE